MPKNIMLYNPEKVTSSPKILENLGRALNSIVAKAASTDDFKLDPDLHVDFVLQPLVPGSIAPDVSFELEMIGTRARRIKLTEEVMKEMQERFRSALSVTAGMPKLGSGKPPIWLKYVDPDGHHV